MAILSFGITYPQALAMANGILVCLWGGLQMGVYFKVRFL
jgi:hypothetical protein